MELRVLPYLMLPPLFWSSNAILGSLLVGRVPPMALNALRWWVAFVLLAPFAWNALRRWRLIFADLRWIHLLWTGLLAVGAYNALQYLALVTSSAINVTLIASSAPIWMLGFGALLYREPVSVSQAIGAALSIAGVLATLSRGDLSTLTQIDFVIGDLFILVAIATWCIYSWTLARPPRSMRPGIRPDWNWADYLLLQILFGLFWVSVSAGVEFAFTDQRIIWNWWVAAAIVYIAIGPALVAYWSWGVAVVRAGPALAAFFTNLIPVFTALLSSVLLQELPQWYHVVSFLLIAAGIAIANFSNPTSKDQPSKIHQATKEV